MTKAAKNGPDLIKNTITVLNGKGKLVPMWMRLRGGSGGPCDAQGVDSSNPKVRREGPTVYVGGNQSNFDKHINSDNTDEVSQKISKMKAHACIKNLKN